MMIALTIKEMKYLAIDLSDDLVGLVSYLYL